MEFITAIEARDLPTYSATTTSSSSTSTSITYTTPSITIPANNNNPYILRESNLAGTVFIAVGAIVGAILLIFIFYHLIVSFTASRIAKKSTAADYRFMEKYNGGSNHNGHTPTGSTLFNVNSEYQPLVAKLPLLSHHNASRSIGGGSQVGGIYGNESSFYQASEVGTLTSKNDLSKLFISPTAEVMGHRRNKSNTFSGSTANLSVAGGAGGSQSHMSSPQHRYSQHGVPNIYMNSETDYSDSLVGGAPASSISSPQRRAEPGRQGRSTIPSMYLDDLIDQ